MDREPEPAAVAAYVEQVAAQLGLSIEPGWRDSAVRNVTGYFTIAAWLEEFPLPEQVEAAPVFEP